MPSTFGPGSVIELRDVLPAPRLNRTQRLWLPGDIPSTNKLMELSRTEGFNAGVRHYQRATRRRQTRTSLERPHALAIRQLRNAAHMAALKYLTPCPPEHWVRLAFFLIGHPRYDADAWYLAAKPIADGLQDAGIIGRDGADVHSTEGRCVRSAEEAAALLSWHVAIGTKTRHGGPVPAGMLVEVSPWG